MFHVPLCRWWDGSGPDQQAPLSRGRAGCFDIVPTQQQWQRRYRGWLARAPYKHGKTLTAHGTAYGKRFEIDGTKTNRSGVNLHLVMHSSALFS